MRDDRATPAGSRSSLDRIFDPRSIAVVGASAEPAKRGYQIIQALETSGYEGDVYPVNPRGGTILDRHVFPSLAEVPGRPDLAVLCTPAAAAPELVRACGVHGIAGAIVLAVGFRESGPAGAELEDRLRTAGVESGVRIVGPNTSGMLNLGRGVNLVGAKGVRAGSLAVVVQSGNVALALMNEVTERSRDGVSIYLGVGNETDLGFRDALDFLEHHDETRAIIVYAEAIQHTRSFLASAARITRSKPVVAIKSARTRAGAAAAASHTGSVAGPYDRLRAAMAQAGIVEVTRTDELLHVAETLGNQPAPPAGAGITVLSDGGGQGTLAVDTLAEAGARVATLSEGTRDRLRTLLGPAAAVANPVDLAGAADADPTVFARALDIIAGDADVGTVLLVGLFGGYGVRFADRLTSGEIAAAHDMSRTMREAVKGLVVHTMYASHWTEPLTILGEARIPVVGSLEVACRCVVELQRRGVALTEPVWRPAGGEHAVSEGEGAASASGGVASADGGASSAGEGAEPGALVRDALASGRSSLTEPEARSLLSAFGLDFAPSIVAASADEVAAALQSLAVPCAVKLVSETITHKSDAGGVVLDVRTAAEGRQAFDRIVAGATAYARARGSDRAPARVLVTPMHPPPRAELLIGAYRDADLGPVLTVGVGGIWVEAARDVTHRVLPVTDADIAGMIEDVQVRRLLDAGRGRAAAATGPVVAAARAIATCITSLPAVAEVEVNPLFVYDERSVPVDARVILAGAGQHSAPGSDPTSA